MAHNPVNQDFLRMMAIKNAGVSDILNRHVAEMRLAESFEPVAQFKPTDGSNIQFIGTVINDDNVVTAAMMQKDIPVDGAIRLGDHVAHIFFSASMLQNVTGKDPDLRAEKLEDRKEYRRALDAVKERSLRIE